MNDNSFTIEIQNTTQRSILLNVLTKNTINIPGNAYAGPSLEFKEITTVIEVHRLFLENPEVQVIGTTTKDTHTMHFSQLCEHDCPAILPDSVILIINENKNFSFIRYSDLERLLSEVPAMRAIEKMLEKLTHIGFITN